jgi:hypothetical protein
MKSTDGAGLPWGERILAGREIIFEFAGYGEYAQVRAIDAVSGVEVAVTTPAAAARHDQERLAARKLARALEARFGLPGPGRKGILA